MPDIEEIYEVNLLSSYPEFEISYTISGNMILLTNDINSTDIELDIDRDTNGLLSLTYIGSGCVRYFNDQFDESKYLIRKTCIAINFPEALEGYKAPDYLEVSSSVKIDVYNNAVIFSIKDINSQARYLMYEVKCWAL